MRHGPGKYLTGSALDARVAQFGARSFIRSVQRGTISMAHTVASATATITTVDPNNAILVFGPFSAVYAADLDENVRTRLTFTNATTITATRLAGSGELIISFEVVEFWPGVIKSVQRGTITLASGATSNTATVTQVDTTKATLMDLGHTVDASTTTLTTQCARRVLTNATTITATRVTGTGEVILGYQLVEFY